MLFKSIGKELFGYIVLIIIHELILWYIHIIYAGVYAHCYSVMFCYFVCECVCVTALISCLSPLSIYLPPPFLFPILRLCVNIFQSLSSSFLTTLVHFVMLFHICVPLKTIYMFIMCQKLSAKLFRYTKLKWHGNCNLITENKVENCNIAVLFWLKV